MLDIHLKNDAERLTGLPVYPLQRPDDVNECIVYQVVSDFKPDTGLAGVSLITQRYQFKIISPSRVKTIWGTELEVYFVCAPKPACSLLMLKQLIHYLPQPLIRCPVRTPSLRCTRWTVTAISRAQNHGCMTAESGWYRNSLWMVT